MKVHMLFPTKYDKVSFHLHRSHFLCKAWVFPTAEKVTPWVLSHIYQVDNDVLEYLRALLPFAKKKKNKEHEGHRGSTMFVLTLLLNSDFPGTGN